ncbi:hypothetical protein H0H81_003283 [Sphagnurus paluster]|uniref:14-3-3 domain-containing protein n=1 Tax=Sphagnurus paluster TaxID=117069 RepID=A0A9P7FZN8_9AGAR|nr:hypothetical protein H0H81_003283 [Sphagnurus paluster]
MSPARTRPERYELLFIADLAGEAGRHKGQIVPTSQEAGWRSLINAIAVDVVKQIKLIIEHFGPQLSTEERSLLSIAYKSITNNLRNSWRVVDTLYKVQATRKGPLHLIQRQRQHIETELIGTCKDVVRLLDRELMPAASEGEEKVFYSKL